MNIFLANPRGFCAGVKRAINIVTMALKIYGKPIYVNHEIVHNTYVIKHLESKGVIFNKNIDTIPKGAIFIFSAHGVSKHIEEKAKRRKLKIIDATCPLVKKVHREVSKASKLNFEAILIGTSKHPEINGTLGQYTNKNGNIYLIQSIEDISKLKIKNPNKIMLMTQTTLSYNKINPIIKKLYEKYPNIKKPKNSDICYATINRQKAVKNLLKLSDSIIIIGSKHSSNSNQLLRIAKETNKNSTLIDSHHEINTIYWINKVKSIGIAAGASTPNIIIQNVIKELRKTYKNNNIQEILGIQENIKFHIPKELNNKI
ncbi:MAG: 4-hydroxy-3-methylbut-2-enyl diphosphate reductase [Buchnera aphidicola (Nurudea yanoniella)]